MGHLINRRTKVLSQEDIDQITSTYHNWRNTNGNYEDIKGFCKSESKERVAELDYVLTPGRYVGLAETEDDFEQTMELVRAVKYSQAYSFKYSPRPGTPAAIMEDQVDEAIKSERLSRLQALLKEQQTEFNNSVIDKVLPVLIEAPGKTKNTLFGRSPYMQAVQVSVGDLKYEELQGKIVDVLIKEGGPFNIQGVLV